MLRYLAARSELEKLLTPTEIGNEYIAIAKSSKIQQGNLLQLDKGGQGKWQAMIDSSDTNSN